MTTATDQARIARAVLDADRTARRNKRNARIERLVASLLETILAGWGLMLAVGNIHHDWIAACPTVGFGHAVLLSALLRVGLAIPKLPTGRGGAT